MLRITPLPETKTGRMFQCPQCKETIDTLAKECRFCKAPIDPAQAEEAANRMEMVNKAMSQFPGGEFCKHVLLSPTSITEVMFFGLVGMWGIRLVILMYGFTFLLPAFIVWRLKWGSFQFEDPDFVRAKQLIRRNIITGLVFFLLLAGFIVLASLPASLREY